MLEHTALPPVQTPPAWTDTPSPSRRLLLWTVRILLECILVLTIFSAVLQRGQGEPDGASEGLWESIPLRILVGAWGRVLVDHPLRYPLDDWHGSK